MDHKNAICFVLCSVIVYYANAQTQNAFFRKDYKFLAGPQAFYKIHTIRRTWQDAKKRCSMEGATLYYADDKYESDAVLELWHKTQPFPRIWAGISDLLSKGDFETIDGKSINDVYNNWESGEPNDADGVEDCVLIVREGQLNDVRCDDKIPFICKKTLASMEWNLFCDMPDLTYQYNGALGRCYKWHPIPMNWTEAYSVCAAEQSYLGIINSQEEHDFFVKFIADAPKNVYKKIDYLNGVVHLGFHNRNDEGWTSVKGVKMENNGWFKWGGGQPDGPGRKDEFCGSMFFGGGLNDIGCEHKCYFICEHEVGLLSADINERLGDSKGPAQNITNKIE